jgi:predicted nucleotidyltransferase
MMDIKIDKERLINLCQKYNIQLIILHGSYATGNAASKSDIDIAILGREKFDSNNKLNILNDFSEIFGDKFDPVFLNGAEPLISYQAAIRGKPLYEKTQGAFQQFRLQAVARYMDSKKFRDMEKLYLKRAIGKA